MADRKHEELRRLFDRLIATPAAERGALLEQECAGDCDLRRRLEAMVAAAEDDRFLAAATAGDAAQADGAAAATPGAFREAAGTHIGPYKLLQSLGEGGMGTVWVAEQEHPVKRRVAIKLIKAGMDSAQVLRRFEAERQALALMDHTNIAKVLDVGTTAQGRPYFAMELVKGVPITKYCDELHLSLRERLELFVPVCQAIQHAHQKGIIHRDIKPSNVLVAMQDGKPVPKVIDFGVAKALHQRLSERSMYTEIGAMIGTLEYMSPEQAELSTLDIDTRADVYALGVLLYELLTGSTPLDRRRLEHAAYSDMLRIIKEEEPPKPSTRLTDSQDSLANLAAQRRTEPARLTKDVRGELDWIVMKCLEKDRTRRYETANGLARDIERHLHDEAVEACPQSAGYRLRRIARKHRRGLATAVAFAGLLIAGTVISVLQAVRAIRAEVRATKDREAAEANFGLARDAVDSYLASITDDPDLRQQDLNHLRKRLLQTAIPFYEDLVRQKPGDLHQEVEHGRAYSRLGNVRGLMGDLETALVEYQKAEEIFAHLANAPDGAQHRGRLATAQEATGWTLEQLGKGAEAEGKYRQSLANWQQVAAENPKDTANLASVAQLHGRLGTVLRETGNTRAAEVEHRLGYEQIKALAAQSPKDAGLQAGLVTQCIALGQVLSQLGKSNEALPIAREAFTIREQLLAGAPDDPNRQGDLAEASGELASVLEDLRLDAQAEEAFRRAFDLEMALALRFPTVPNHRYSAAVNSSNWGRMLIRLFRYDDGAKAYRRAIELSDALIQDFPKVPNYVRMTGTAHGNYGLLLFDQKHIPEAEAQFRLAIDIGKRLTAESPDDTSHQLFVVQALNNLATLQDVKHDRTGAEVSYVEALELNRALVRQDGNAAEFRNHLGMVLHNFAAHLATDSSRRDEATALYREGIALFEQLAKETPGIPDRQRLMAACFNGLGILRKSEGAIADAEENFRKGIAILSKLADDFPGDYACGVALGGMDGNLGGLLHDDGRPTEAIEVLAKGIDLLARAVKQSSADQEARRYLRNDYCKRAYALSALDRHAEAAADWHHSFEWSDQPIDRKARLGEAIEQARVDGRHEHVPELAASLATDDGIDSETLYGMACICAETARDEKLRESYAPIAVAMLDQAVQLGNTSVESLSTDKSFDRIRERADFQAVIAEARTKRVDPAAVRRP